MPVENKDRVLQRQQQKYAALECQYKEESQRLSTALAALQAEQEKYHVLQQQVAEKNKQLKQLIHWIESLKVDIHSIFNSFTWKSGDFLTQLVLKVLFKKAGSTAKDHIDETLNAITANTINTEDTPVPSSTTAVHTPAAPIPAMGTADYATWIANYDSVTPAQIERIEQHIDTWEKPPLISIILSTDNPAEHYLHETLASISQQLYPHWELCIIDNASTASHVKPLLESYAEKDIRMTCHYQSEKTTQSTIYNMALNKVTGEFVSFVKQGDVLASTALFWVADALQHHDEISLCYVDEDKVDPQGQRCEPHFKPDWNPDLFLSSPFIQHLAIYKTALVKKIEGFRVEYDGAHENDLILRIIESIPTTQIYHIPRVLYHWRDIAEQAQKTHHIRVTQKAIQDYLNRHHKKATVTASTALSDTFYIQYSIPSPPPLVSLLIYCDNNKLGNLKNCLQHLIEKTAYAHYEILIVMNQSDKLSKELMSFIATLENKANIRIIQLPDSPDNEAEIYNKAVEQAQGDLIGLLSVETEVINTEWLTEMVSHAIRPEVGAVGARLWHSNDTLYHAGIMIGINKSAGYTHQRFKQHTTGYQGRTHLIQNYSAVSAACMVMQKSYFMTVGGFSSLSLKKYLYDVDLCLKIQKLNLRIVWTPYADLYHHTGQPRQDSVVEKMQYEEEKNYLRNHWEDFYKHDPAYSPNLTLHSEDFSYAWPPRVPLF